MKKAFTKRKSNHATFMYIPESQSKVVSLRIPKWLPIAAALGIVVLLIGIFSSFRILKSVNDEYSKSKDEISKLAALNNSQKQEIQKMQDDALEIRLQLEENIKTLDEIKAIVGIEKNSDAEEKTQAPQPIAAPSKDTSYNVSPQINQIQESYTELSKAVLSQRQVIDSSMASVKKQVAYLRARPSIRPVSGRITNTFGYRKNPFTNRGSEFHKGVDIAGDYGSSVKATGDGVVIFAGWQSGYGKVIIISHGYGLTTLYGHNSRLLVKTGDKIKKSQVISKMGSTGRSTGTHLHYEVRVNGKVVNPSKYF